MRIRPWILGGLAILLLGATTPAGCSIPWLALLGGLNPAGQVLTVQVINTAYQPVQFSLVTSRVTQSAATAPSTQPGGSTLDRDGEYDTTFPCTSIPEVLACKATLVEINDTAGKSAASTMLHNNTDYFCGSKVTFTVRPIAGGGIVVGAETD